MGLKRQVATRRFLLFLLLMLIASQSVANDPPFDYFVWPLTNLKSGSFQTITFREHILERDNEVTYDSISSLVFWKGRLGVCFDVKRDQSVSALWINGFQYAPDDSTEVKGACSFGFVPHKGQLRPLVTQGDKEDQPGEFDFGFSLRDALQGVDVSGVICDDTSDTFTMNGNHYMALITKRNAVGHSFFGSPVMHYLCKSDDGSTQVLGGLLGENANPKSSAIVSRTFRIPAKLVVAGRPESLRHSRFDVAEVLTLTDQEVSDLSWVRDSRVEAKRLLRQNPESLNNQAEIYLDLLKLTHEINFTIDRFLSDGDAVMLDPVVRGQFLHRVSWSPLLKDSLPQAIYGLTEHIKSREMLFALFCTSASIGISDEIRVIHLLSGFLSDDGHGSDSNRIFRAAVGAHWHLPVKESEIDAVAELLKTAVLPSVRSEAIDVLVLLGQIDKVPADRMAAWADANVLKAEPRLLRRKLAYLMKTKSGRDYLRGQLGSPGMSAETKDVVKAVITKHVEATKKLKRFDMISEGEVGELEKSVTGGQ
jgi:hypothetical protein